MSNDPDKIILSREQYPGNSLSSRKQLKGDEEVDTRVKRKKVVSGKRVKKSFGKRLASTFNEGEAGSEVVSYIMHDVVIPAAKATFADLVEGAIEMLLFGGERNSRVRRHGGRSYVSYSDMYNKNTGRRDTSRRGGDLRARNRHDFSSIVLSSRQEAELVLTELATTIEEYDVVSVADLYDIVGIDAEFTDAKYGWVEFDGMSTKRVREGWVLDLPRPRVID
jgi:hypothetical protein